MLESPSPVGEEKPVPVTPAPGVRQPARPAGRIPSLDGLRAVSILIVFLAHTGMRGIVPGFFGVTVFFFLSGYLITTLLRIEFEGTGDIGLRSFYVRRAFRIWPLFYLVLIVATLLTALGAYGPPPPLDAGLIFMQFAHLANYAITEHGWYIGRAQGTWVYWSLAVEEHFYLALPVVYLAMLKAGLRPRRQAAIFSPCAWSHCSGAWCSCSDSTRLRNAYTSPPTPGSTRSCSAASWRSSTTPCSTTSPAAKPG